MIIKISHFSNECVGWFLPILIRKIYKSEDENGVAEKRPNLHNFHDWHFQLPVS